MVTIVGIAGSLRQGSCNAALLRAAAALFPPGSALEIASIRDIPLYDGDLEAAAGIPAPVHHLKERIAAADGLLLATPEYNHSVPGVLKNAVDWLSRPPGDIPRVFGGLPVALLGATPGPGGTRMAQAAWLPILRALGTRLWFGEALYVASAAARFDGDGNLSDDSLRARLERFVSGFVAFAESGRGARRRPGTG